MTAVRRKQLRQLGDIGRDPSRLIARELPVHKATLSLTPPWRLASAMSMTGELTDLDRTVIEALSVRYARGGEAAFDEAVSGW